jgi:hypothetical protein
MPQRKLPWQLPRETRSRPERKLQRHVRREMRSKRERKLQQPMRMWTRSTLGEGSTCERRRGRTSMTGGWPNGLRRARSPLAVRLGRVGRGTEWSPGRVLGEWFGGPNTEAGRYEDRPGHPPVRGHRRGATFFAYNIVSFHLTFCTDTGY